MTEKILGYILLTVGMLMIILPAISVYQVFTKQAEPIKLFNFNGISIDPSQLVGQSSQVSISPELQSSLGIKLPAQKSQTAPKTEIVSAQMINDTSNVFAHLFLMGFLASIGQKIASLGVQLVRPIVVKLKENVV